MFRAGFILRARCHFVFITDFTASALTHGPVLLSRCRHFRCTCSAASRSQRNGRQTVRAIPGVGWWGWFSSQPVDGFDDQKDDERDDQKADDVVKKSSVGNNRKASQ